MSSYVIRLDDREFSTDDIYRILSILGNEQGSKMLQMYAKAAFEFSEPCEISEICTGYVYDYLVEQIGYSDSDWDLFFDVMKFKKVIYSKKGVKTNDD